MKRTFTTLVMALALALSMLAPASADHVGYNDVNTSTTHYFSIRDLAHFGITQPVDGNNYRPSWNLTRAQMASLVARNLDSVYTDTFQTWRTGPTSFQQYSDVPTSHPNYQDIMHLGLAGIANGYTDGSFGVNDPVTRAQFATFTSRMLDEISDNTQYDNVWKTPCCPSNGGSGSFPDVPTSFVHYNAIRDLNRLGIISGYPDGTFRPSLAVNRAQAATLIARANDRWVEVNKPASNNYAWKLQSETP